MTKTLILTLGVSGDKTPVPAGHAHLEIDGTAPRDIQAVHLEVDASKPSNVGHFCVHRAMILDGQVWELDETHQVSNMSLIIEYEEAQ